MRRVLDRLRAPERASDGRNGLSLPSGEVVVYGATVALLFGGLFLVVVLNQAGYLDPDA